MSEEKSRADALKEELFLDFKNAALRMESDEVAEADRYCGGYKDFITRCKTERETVSYVADLAEKAGFRPLKKGSACRAGDKILLNNRGKALILAVIGEKDLSEGVRIAAAHIDAPRLDMKPSPLYEDSDLALLKTHYYGGIKKYQWTAVPLSIHGVIVKKNGETVTVSIGEKEGEPRFVVNDLLPHLDGEMRKRNASEAIKGEELNILVGSRPFRSDKGSELVKLQILKLLNEKFGIIEEDFLSAELEAVPAYPAVDIGFDASLIGAYGHDDRVCAYPCVTALLACGKPLYTTLAVLSDKEETGSDGNTGLASSFLADFIGDLAADSGFSTREVLRHSSCLSADVNAAFDPTFPSVHDKLNAAYINKGIVLTKYTGARGKSGTSDASAEFTGQIRKVFNDAGVIWQTGELGKVDEGGGGTVAKYIANLGVDTIDVGVPVLSMHSPFEVVSKLDVYMTHKAVLAFYSA